MRGPAAVTATLSPASPVPYGVADQNLPQQIRVRLGKRERLLESGGEPYPAGFERTATAAGLRARYGDLPPDMSAGEVITSRSG